MHTHVLCKYLQHKYFYSHSFANKTSLYWPPSRPAPPLLAVPTSAIHWLYNLPHVEMGEVEPRTESRRKYANDLLFFKKIKKYNKNPGRFRATPLLFFIIPEPYSYWQTMNNYSLD